ncbi:unnamed protein product, partial [Discosporangium mesarthrocarpum]
MARTASEENDGRLPILRQLRLLRGRRFILMDPAKPMGGCSSAGAVSRKTVLGGAVRGGGARGGGDEEELVFE